MQLEFAPTLEQIRQQATACLEEHDRLQILAHTIRVAGEARRLALAWKVPAAQAEIGAWLHDISGILTPAEQVEYASQHGIPTLQLEREVPKLLHQKISAHLAKAQFGVEDRGILSAIECHTTLKPKPSRLDLVVFLADKIEWDQQKCPPYQPALNQALERSLEEAAYVYLHYLWQNRHSLLGLHPWMIAAFRYFSAVMEGNIPPGEGNFVNEPQP